MQFGRESLRLFGAIGMGHADEYDETFTTELGNDVSVDGYGGGQRSLNDGAHAAFLQAEQPALLLFLVRRGRQRPRRHSGRRRA